MNTIQQILAGFMTHFELILTVTVIICFIFYLIDGRSYRKTRKRLYRAFKTGTETQEDRIAYATRLATVIQGKGVRRKHQNAFDRAQHALTQQEPLKGAELYWLKHPVYPQEKFIEFFGGMFWVLFTVWFIRSFLWEPFRIPSGSMEPNLYDGDFILTSKYSYGIKLPVLRSTIIPTGTTSSASSACPATTSATNATTSGSTTKRSRWNLPAKHAKSTVSTASAATASPPPSTKKP